MIYQLSFYVPETHVEQVKESLFKAGAGKPTIHMKNQLIILLN